MLERAVAVADKEGVTDRERTDEKLGPASRQEIKIRHEFYTAPIDIFFQRYENFISVN